jgi:hypothetical protein
VSADWTADSAATTAACAGDLAFGSGYPGLRLADFGIADLFLTPELREFRRCCVQCGLRRFLLRLVVVVPDGSDQLPGVDVLIFRYFHAGQKAGGFGAQGCDVRPDIGVVGTLIRAAALPAIPVAVNQKKDSGGKEQNDQGDYRGGKVERLLFACMIVRHLSMVERRTAKLR